MQRIRLSRLFYNLIVVCFILIESNISITAAEIAGFLNVSKTDVNLIPNTTAASVIQHTASKKSLSTSANVFSDFTTTVSSTTAFPNTITTPPYTTTTSTTSRTTTTNTFPYTNTTTSRTTNTSMSPYTTTSSTTPWITTTNTSRHTTTPTTSRPTPVPKPLIPEEGIWSVKFQTKDSVCLLLGMAASIDTYYVSVYDKIEKGVLYIPANAKSTGSCEGLGSHRQRITLSWSYNSYDVNSLQFTFRKNSHLYEIHKIVVNITLDSGSFPDARDTTTTLVNNNDHFFTPEKLGYRCDNLHVIPLYTSGEKADVGHLKLHNIYFVAFGNVGRNDRVKSIDCKVHHFSIKLSILLGAAVVAVIAAIVLFCMSKKRKHLSPSYIYLVEDNRDETEYNTKNKLDHSLRNSGQFQI